MAAPSCSGERGMKIASSKSTESARVQRRAGLAELFESALLFDREQRAARACESRNAACASAAMARVLRPRRAVLALVAVHPEQAAAADLLERAAQFRLENDRNRHRGADDDQLQNRDQQVEVQQVGDAEQRDEHQDSHENLHGARAANQQQQDSR